MQENLEIIANGNVANKDRNLILGIIFDIIGTASFTIPLLGEFSDVIWAPISALLMARMYKGTRGKVGAAISFFEEIIPFTDFIPSFTLMWLYTYILNSKSSQ